MRIVAGIIHLLAAAGKRTKTVGGTAVILLTSLGQLLLRLLRLGPAQDLARLRGLYFRRLEASTRSMEIDVDRKIAEIQRVHAETAKLRIETLSAAGLLEIRKQTIATAISDKAASDGPPDSCHPDERRFG